MSRIIKAAISGGPCAGKTTALNRMQKKLEEKGNAVILINETATELLQAGLKPFGDKEENIVPLKEFQKAILRTQIAKEDQRLETAQSIPNPKKIAICDRGANDNGAYLGDEGFDELLAEEGYTREELLDRYDIVIYFVSTAIDREDLYQNTEERVETPQQARRLDVNTIRMWCKHKNLVIIFNDGTMEEKIDVAVEKILETQARIEQEDSPKIYQK